MSKEHYKYNYKKDYIKDIICPHYNIKCNIISDCCNKSYACKYCHDDNEDHKVINIKKVQCNICGLNQNVSNECIRCKTKFASTFCKKCMLWTNKKHTYHCDGCGHCKVGNKKDFFHCDKCNICLAIKFKNNHVCIENISNSDCPICLESINESIIPLKRLRCGHILHEECLEKYFDSNIENHQCPYCKTDIIE
jgi:RING finger and CHY zinc finger domain-containing protein 1